MAAKWQMKGEYLKTCSCAPGCPCDFWAPPTETLCEGMIAMRVQEGHFDSVPLNGRTWAVAFHWPGPLHLGNGTLQPYVDEAANQAQRDALLTILSGKAGGPWFEVVASLVTTVHAPKFVAIKWEFDREKRRGRCVVGGEADATVEPIKGADNKDLRAQICLPQGMEYFTAEVAVAKVLKSTGAVKFNRSGVHGSFSHVDHSPAGLKR
jgi:hypothetical protein